jgi:hypothetical protein
VCGFGVHPAAVVDGAEGALDTGLDDEVDAEVLAEVAADFDAALLHADVTTTAIVATTTVAIQPRLEPSYPRSRMNGNGIGARMRAGGRPGGTAPVRVGAGCAR